MKYQVRMARIKQAAIILEFWEYEIKNNSTLWYNSYNGEVLHDKQSTT